MKAGAVRSGGLIAGVVLTGLMAAGLTMIGARNLRAEDVAARLLPIAVFGRDDREPIGVRHARLRSQIGLLYNARTRTVCSAFCAADDIIATAAHCLFRTASERPLPLEGFRFSRFAAGERTATAIAGAETRTSSLHIVAGSTRLSVQPPIDATSDWALVRLVRPVCRQVALALRPLPPDEIIELAREGRVYQVAFHRDVPGWQLTYSRPCPVARDYPAASWPQIARDFSGAGDLLLHTCDTGGASSGSPLLVDGPRGPEVVGINVGTYVLSRMMMQGSQVVQRLKPENVANTAVAARAFADRLELLRRAVIVSEPPEVRALQARLRERGLYSGPLDGRYGSELRGAIVALERAEGRPTTGLATTELLARLGVERSSPPRPGELPSAVARGGSDRPRTTGSLGRTAQPRR